MDAPKTGWWEEETKIPADLTTLRNNKPGTTSVPAARPRSTSPVRRPKSPDQQQLQQPRSHSATRRGRNDPPPKQWNEPPRIVCVSPRIVPNREAAGNRVHFLDSIYIRRLFPERPVMTRRVNHVALHTFDTANYKTTKNATAVLDTNTFCRSIAFKDPNTGVHHIISFDNVYDFTHEYEDADPYAKKDIRNRPRMDIEKQVEMTVQIVSPEQDKQLSENRYVYRFRHKIRVYCPSAKLQTWATTFRASDVIDYCDVDPYLSASTAVNPTMLQVHYHHITHHVKLVHLICRPHHIHFQDDKKPQHAGKS